MECLFKKGMAALEKVPVYTPFSQSIEETG